MTKEYSELSCLVAKLQETIEQSCDPDGALHLDYCKTKLVLEFALSEIKKTITA